MGSKELAPLRQKVLAATRGTVIEVGVGSGANFPYYPPDIESLVGIDNHAGMVRALDIDERLRGKIKVKIGDAAAIPVGNATADFVVSTFTLCSVPDPAAVLAEVRRVLKSDGKFIFLEHGLSDSHVVQRWQNWLTPLNRRIAGGCCLNRNYAILLSSAGFKLDDLENFYLPKAPKTHGFLYRGVASVGETRVSRHSPQH